MWDGPNIFAFASVLLLALAVSFLIHQFSGDFPRHLPIPPIVAISHPMR